MREKQARGIEFLNDINDDQLDRAATHYGYNTGTNTQSFQQSLKSQPDRRNDRTLGRGANRQPSGMPRYGTSKPYSKDYRSFMK